MATVHQPNFFQTWLKHHVEKRFNPQQDAITLQRRGVYIVPSALGLVFIVLGIATLVMALNFNNNALFILLFFLAGITLLSMLQTHANLLHLTLQLLPPAECYAGDNAQFNLELRSDKPRWSLQVSTAHTRCVLDLKAQQNYSIQIPVHSEHCGYLAAPRIKISSRYPLGLFTTWSWYQSGHKAIIFPQPVAHSAAEFTTKLPQHAQKNTPQTLLATDNTLDDIRTYQTTDPLQQIAWKASAKHKQLMTRQRQQGLPQGSIINWDNTAGTILEKQQQLCFQINELHRQGLPWKLSMPYNSSAMHTGLPHKILCLKAIALYPKPIL